MGMEENDGFSQDAAPVSPPPPPPTWRELNTQPQRVIKGGYGGFRFVWCHTQQWTRDSTKHYVCSSTSRPGSQSPGTGKIVEIAIGQDQCQYQLRFCIWRCWMPCVRQMLILMQDYFLLP